MKDVSGIDRRRFLKVFAMLGLGSGAAVASKWLPSGVPIAQAADGGHTGHTMPAPQTAGGHNTMSTGNELARGAHLGNTVVGDVDPATNGFDPTEILSDFDYGKTSTLANGRTLREFQLVAQDKTIEIAPGVTFPAWTYNGRVPGPTLRCTQGDLIRVHFSNEGTHPHSVHFHGIHPASMDGIEPIFPGGSTTYEFDAEPFGLHLYHCHTMPLRRHIHKGLYGTFIIDPPQPRPPAHELVMVMNAFDTNFDAANEFYAVNTVAFHFAKHPIAIKLGELVRVYLVNVTEFDPINSFHLHANLFNVYRTGTRLEPHEYTDLIMMAQAERHILEFSFKFPGEYMFHAHVSEFTELGWMGAFKVTPDGQASSAPAAALARLFAPAMMGGG